MPSSDFQKIIRDLNNISDKLEIKSIKKPIRYSSVRAHLPMLKLYVLKVTAWDLYKRTIISSKVYFL